MDKFGTEYCTRQVIFFGTIDAFTPGVILAAVRSKFVGVTAVWRLMAWRWRKQAVVN